MRVEFYGCIIGELYKIINLRIGRNVIVYVKPGDEMRKTYFFSVSDTDILGKRNWEFSQQESNLRPSHYKFGCSTTELQETPWSYGQKLGPRDKHPAYC